MEASALMKNAPGQDFQIIFQTYYPKVVHQIAGFVGQKSTAEDLAQEVFLRLYHQDWSRITNLKAWLTRSSLNAFCNYLRSEKRRTVREENEARRHEPFLTDTSAELIIREETRHSVMAILYCLEEREKHLLLLNFNMGEDRFRSQCFYTECLYKRRLGRMGFGNHNC